MLCESVNCLLRWAFWFQYLAVEVTSRLYMTDFLFGLQDFGSAIHGVDTGNFLVLIKA